MSDSDIIEGLKQAARHARGEYVQGVKTSVVYVDDGPWVVVRTQVRQEKRGVVNARNQGFECYLPRAFIRAKDNTFRLAPLFPGYFFVRYVPGKWIALRSTWGVIDVVMGAGDGPALMDNLEIEHLRAREDRAGFVHLESDAFQSGEHVRISGGPFVGLTGVVDSMAAQDRVFVLLSVLGRQTKAAFNVDTIERK